MPDMLIRLAQINGGENEQAKPTSHDRLTDRGKLRRMGRIAQHGPGNARQISSLRCHEQQTANGKNHACRKDKLQPCNRCRRHHKRDEHRNADKQALIEKIISRGPIKDHALL